MKIRFDNTTKIQKSNLAGYAQVCVASKEIEGLIGKKCEIKGELEIKEV